MKKTIQLKEIEEIRGRPSRSILLFITDRCPVGCAHCSVNSRPDSPSIRDYELFTQILNGITMIETVELVGISGGEPFVERKALTNAVTHLADYGKYIALYTSGFWAKNFLPEWIQFIISKVSCVFLSTDQFHQSQVDVDCFLKAAHAIISQDTWLIVQVLDMPEEVFKVQELLATNFGAAWKSYAEISLIPPLPFGRGENLFSFPKSYLGSQFGKCKLISSPTIRYNGILSACCNERVIMGHGPQRLSTSISNSNELKEKFNQLFSDPIFQLIRKSGMKHVVAHPDFQSLASQEYTSICQVCFQIQEIASEKNHPDAIMTALSKLV